MYILYWHTESGRKHVSGNANSVLCLADVFEDQKIQFSVSSESGRHSQHQFGVEGYKYWVGCNELFSG